MGTFIPADANQPIREVEPENGTDFQLDQLYTLLSCDNIETRFIADGLVMVSDAESKFAHKPRNERATRIADFVTPKQLIIDLLHTRASGIEPIWVGDPITDAMEETDYIAGDALVCREGEI